ncbi:ABC transporter permease [Nocardioides mesophilus]|uniref:ABC transporter permease n=1 Tax=Nocardioides mesophilus TaxID=433659 RepID=UPI001FE447CE|nr:ABC transporter permease [Nocardioides mesophilus]
MSVLTLLVIVGPWIAPYSSSEFVGAPFTLPSGSAWLGTDGLGRDVLSRFLSGGRSVLAMSLLAAVSGVGAGAFIGLFAAHAGGLVDGLLMRLNDVLLAFPQIIFTLLVLTCFGPHTWLIALTVGMTHAPRTALVIRAAAVQVAERDFVKAAEAAGESRARIIFAELLPNVSSPLLVEFGLRLTYSIGLVAAVSFLGFGLQPPAADWGLMINENRIGITTQPWAVVVPVAAIGLLTIGVNFVTDAIARSTIGIDREGEQ